MRHYCYNYRVRNDGLRDDISLQNYSILLTDPSLLRPMETILFQDVFLYNTVSQTTSTFAAMLLGLITTRLK